MFFLKQTIGKRGGTSTKRCPTQDIDTSVFIPFGSLGYLLARVDLHYP